MSITWGKPHPPQLKQHKGKKRIRINCGRCTQNDGFCWHQCRRKYAGSLAIRQLVMDMFSPEKK